jgi:hypothetical protein
VLQIVMVCIIHVKCGRVRFELLELIKGYYM